MFQRALIFTALHLLRFSLAHDDNGLARTPQMGWNSWNKFACDISEETILSAAHTIVESGLKALGYECWQAPSRHPETLAPMADPIKFPHGIKHISDEVHRLGLKIGIYSDAGKYTCGYRFGSLDFEEIDAATYASWEIDYLKYDNCYNEGRAGYDLISYQRYAKMSKALNATGRPILYAICNWGEDGPWNWATTIANSWRISGDISDHFDRYDERCPCDSTINCKLPGFHCSVTRIIDYAAPLGQKAGPGRWNDLDMLEVGNGGMTYDEYVTHFSLWAIVKSPLILGNDITNMHPDTLSIITNEAIIALNQDVLGKPANRIWRRTTNAGGSLQLWVGGLSEGNTVIAVLNISPETQRLNVSFSDVFVDSRAAGELYYRLYDLWEKDHAGSWGKDAGVFTNSIEGLELRPHQTKVWKAVPELSILSDPGAAQKFLDEL